MFFDSKRLQNRAQTPRNIYEKTMLETPRPRAKRRHGEGGVDLIRDELSLGFTTPGPGMPTEIGAPQQVGKENKSGEKNHGLLNEQSACQTRSGWNHKPFEPKNPATRFILKQKSQIGSW